MYGHTYLRVYPFLKRRLLYTYCASTRRVSKSQIRLERGLSPKPPSRSDHRRRQGACGQATPLPPRAVGYAETSLLLVGGRRGERPIVAVLPEAAGVLAVVLLLDEVHHRTPAGCRVFSHHPLPHAVMPGSVEKTSAREAQHIIQDDQRRTEHRDMVARPGGREHDNKGNTRCLSSRVWCVRERGGGEKKRPSKLSALSLSPLFPSWEAPTRTVFLFIKVRSAPCSGRIKIAPKALSVKRG